MNVSRGGGGGGGGVAKLPKFFIYVGNYVAVLNERDFEGVKSTTLNQEYEFYTWVGIGSNDCIRVLKSHDLRLQLMQRGFIIRFLLSVSFKILNKPLHVPVTLG